MKLFLVVIALMFSILGVSQECTFKFSGKVIDFHDRSVIVGASIYIQELEKYAGPVGNFYRGCSKHVSDIRGSWILDHTQNPPIPLLNPGTKITLMDTLGDSFSL